MAENIGNFIEQLPPWLAIPAIVIVLVVGFCIGWMLYMPDYTINIERRRKLKKREKEYEDARRKAQKSDQ